MTSLSLIKILAARFNWIIFGYVLFCILVPKFPLFYIGNYPTPVRVEDFLWVVMMIMGLLVIVTQKISIRMVLLSKISISIIVWLSLVFVSLSYNILSDHVSITNIVFFVRFVQYLSLYYLATMFPFSSLQLIKVLRIVTTVVFVTSVWAILQGFGYVGGFGGGFYGYKVIVGTDRAFASFSGPYELAGFLQITLPIIVAQVITSIRDIRVIILLIVWVVGLIALGFSGARFPVIVAGVSLLPLIIMKPKLKTIVFILVVAILTILIPLTTSKTMVNRFSTLSLNRSDFDSIQIPTPTLIPTLFPTPTEIPTPSGVSMSVTSVPTNKNQAIGLTVSPAKSQALTPTKALNLSQSQTSVTEEKEAEGLILNNPIVERIGSLLQLLAKKDKSFDLRINFNWPMAWRELQRNVFLGGGLGVNGVGLDGEYATLLGETGIVGFFAFVMIFVVLVIEPLWKWRLGKLSITHVAITLCLLVAMLVSAIFSDIFRASKIAILFWFLIASLVSASTDDAKN